MYRRRLAVGLLFSTLLAACGGHDRIDPEAVADPESPGSAQLPRTPAANGDAVESPPTEMSSAERVSGGRKPLHGSPPPTLEVDIAWRDADLSGAVRKDSEAVHAKLQNNSDTKQKGALFLVATGLDGRLIRRRLGAFQLAPGAAREVRVPVARLPIQSERSATFTAVEAELTRSDGSVVTSTTAPLYAYFRNGYREAVFYDENDVATRLDQRALAKSGSGLEARILQEDGTWQGPDDSPSLTATTGVRQGATRLDLAPSSGPTRHALPTAKPADETSNGTANVIPPIIRVCSNWFTLYLDSTNQGEDYLKTRGWHYEPAKFASVQIIDPDWTTNFWDGILDETGCADVPGAQLPLGNYQLVQYSDGQSTLGRSFSTLMTQADGTTYVTLVRTDFSITGSTGGAVTVYPGASSDAINATSIAGQVLFAQTQLAGLGMPAGQYNIKANDGCPELDPKTDACFHAATNEVRTGTTVINGKRGAYWKSMMAHEIGHMVQDRAMGLPLADLTDDSATQPLCRCDHYDTTWGNQSHCLQSRENQGGAEQEGFAQAFATRVLNKTNEFNAVMPYYKPVKFLANGNTAFPPLNIDGWGASPGPWMRTKCPLAGKGVEWDWMVFFYRVSTESSTNYTSFADIFNIYLRACNNPAKCFSIHDIKWAQLVAAAQAYYGGSTTNPKFVRFRDMGNTAGVNY